MVGIELLEPVVDDDCDPGDVSTVSQFSLLQYMINIAAHISNHINLSVKASSNCADTAKSALSSGFSS